MATYLPMPEVLAGVTEATIAAWMVTTGQTVAEGDVLAEIETEKALVDLTAETGAVIGTLLVAPGTTVEVGTAIAVLLAPGESLDAMPDGAPPAAAPATVDATSPADPDVPAPAEMDPDYAAIGEGDATGTEPETAAEVPAPVATSAPAGQRQFTSPLARRLARERGLDISRIAGTGPNGRVTRRDVERAAETPAAAQPATTLTAEAAARSAAPAPVQAGTAPTATELRPHTPMRRAIARRLAESKATVPHFYLRADCRMDSLLALRAQLNDVASRKISVNDLVVRAVAVAYERLPEANVTWSEEGTLVHGGIDVAVAVSTDGGLLTPVVRNVPGLGITQLSATVADLAERSRAGRLKQHELEGGTATVSNLGMFGTTEFSAILNPPQSLILAVGAATKQPVVHGDSLEVGTVMTVTVSADHRVLDGELAARWLAAFVAAVEAPLSLLI